VAVLESRATNITENNTAAVTLHTKHGIVQELYEVNEKWEAGGSKAGNHADHTGSL